MALRIFVAGSSGQVAQSLDECFKAAGVTARFAGRPAFDLAKPDAIAAAITDFAPTIVVNAAAYTAVDQAEQEEAAAFAINADGAGALASAAAAINIPIIHLSTDYVFDGEKPQDESYQETDPVSPLGVYGRSKLEGERLVAATNSSHVILRTAWVYSPFGKNFVKTMLRVGATRDELNVVADQMGNPTSALDIAAAILAVAVEIDRRAAMIDRGAANADTHRWGVYHLAGTDSAVWADLAAETFRVSKAMGGPAAAVARITTQDYPTPAKRPANSQLSCEKLAADYGVIMPPWRDSVAHVVKRILADGGPNAG